jgi:hypothetical protein
LRTHHDIEGATWISRVLLRDWLKRIRLIDNNRARLLQCEATLQPCFGSFAGRPDRLHIEFDQLAYSLKCLIGQRVNARRFFLLDGNQLF